MSEGECRECKVCKSSVSVVDDKDARERQAAHERESGHRMGWWVLGPLWLPQRPGEIGTGEIRGQTGPVTSEQ